MKRKKNKKKAQKESPIVELQEKKKIKSQDHII